MFSKGSLVVGSEFRRSVTTFMTVLNSDTTTLDAIGLRLKGTRNASAFAATFAHGLGSHSLPFHEHPSPILHRLSGRYRRARRPRANGLQRMVRGLSRRQVVHL